MLQASFLFEGSALKMEPRAKRAVNCLHNCCTALCKGTITMA